MSREKNLVKNTLILSIGTFLPKLTTLITLPILTGCLTKEEFGIFDIVNTLVFLVLPLITLKLEMATFRFLIDCRSDVESSKRIISSSFSTTIPISGVALVIIYLFLRLKSYSVLLSLLISLFFFLDNIYAMFQQTARGLGNNLVYSIAAIINGVVNMILIIIFVWRIQAGLPGLMIALDAALITSSIFLFGKLKLTQYYSLSTISKTTLKQMLGYSWPLVPNSLSSWVMNLSDRLIVTAVLGIEVNAVYAVANKIPNLFNTLQGTFISAWHENASVSVDDKDSEDYYSRMFDKVFTIMIGIMAGLIAITPYLFRVLINPQYAEAFYQMPFLFGGMICFSLSSFMGGIYAAHKQTKSVGITTIVAAALNLTINCVLVRIIGLYAASISTFISYLLLIIFRMVDVKKFQPMDYNKKKIVIYSLAILLMCALTYINNTCLNAFNLAFGITFAFVINKELLTVVLKKNNKLIRK